MTRLLALAAGAFVLLTSVAAAAQTVDVPSRLSSVLPDAQRAGIVVLLPSKINLDYRSGGKIYTDGEGDKRHGRYELELSGAKGCGGSDACVLAEFTRREGPAVGPQVDQRLPRAGDEGLLQAAVVRRILLAAVDPVDPKGRSLRDPSQCSRRQEGVHLDGQQRHQSRQPRVEREQQRLSASS